MKLSQERKKTHSHFCGCEYCYRCKGIGTIPPKDEKCPECEKDSALKKCFEHAKFSNWLDIDDVKRNEKYIRK